MRRVLRNGAALAVLIGLAAGLAASEAQAQGRTMRFSTGPAGSAWGALGNAILSVWEKALPFSDIEPQPGDAVANIEALENGTAEIALSTSSAAAAAISGQAPFTKKFTNVCQLGALFPQALQIFARPEIKAESLADLKGKIVAVPHKGDAAEPVAALVMRENGLDNGAVTTVPADTWEAQELLKAGKVDAAMVGGRIPLREFVEFTKTTPLTILGIPEAKAEAMEQANPGFFTAGLKAGTYNQQDKTALSGAYAVQLLIACNQGETRAYGLLRAVSENILMLLVTESAFQDMDDTTLAEEFGTPIHTGATLFFTEPPTER